MSLKHFGELIILWVYNISVVTALKNSSIMAHWWCMGWCGGVWGGVVVWVSVCRVVWWCMGWCGGVGGGVRGFLESSLSIGEIPKTTWKEYFESTCKLRVVLNVLRILKQPNRNRGVYKNFRATLLTVILESSGNTAYRNRSNLQIKSVTLQKLLLTPQPTMSFNSFMTEVVSI